MPVNKHMEWTDIADFTPGLYVEKFLGTVSQRLQMPINAAQKMDNCVPLKQGGLRAFYKYSSLSTTGITSIA